MYRTLFLLYFCSFSTVLGADQKCNIHTREEKCEFHSSNGKKYSAEANLNYDKYTAIIKAAKKEYKPCEDMCECYSQVISQDLLPFQKGIDRESIDKIKSKGIRYKIINHKLYRDRDCNFPARCSGVEHFLLKLLPKLDDTEFVLNTRDWPQIYHDRGPHGPVFSFSKTNDYMDIMYPAWAFWEGGPAISLYPQGIGRWDEHREHLGKVGNDIEWEIKISKAFFRGSRTSYERDPLILLSRDEPDLVDAKYTKNQAYKSKKDTLNAKPAPEVSFEGHCRYKFLFNFRGVAASFRFKHIFLCKSLVFHVGNEWQEFFYPFLKPWVHYVPVPKGATKEAIKELIEFFDTHQDFAEEIAINGYNFIWNNLKMEHVDCYWLNLLKSYTKLLKFKPESDGESIEIKKKA